MNFELISLRSKVARRIFSLFIIAALIPIILLALMSFREVKDLISGQQYEQLKQTSKGYGMAVLDRLLLLKTRLDWIADDYRQGAGAPSSEQLASMTGQGFKQLGWLGATDTPAFLVEPMERLRRFIQQGERFLEGGGSLIWNDTQSSFPARLYLLRLLDPGHAGPVLLVGEIDQSYLWGEAVSLGEETQVCVLDESDRVLFCSHLEFVPRFEHLNTAATSSSGQFAWRDRDREEYLTSYWSLFLEHSFFVPQWRITATRSNTALSLPLADFNSIFAFVITLTLAIVALLSIQQIRRNLIPLEKLMEGVQRIAAKRFNEPVLVSSGDEFEELAGAVNIMAARIDKQFQTLSTMADLDRLILSTLKIEDIVSILLSRIHEIIPYDHIKVIILGRHPQDSGPIHVKEAGGEGPPVQSSLISESEYLALLNNRGYLVVTDSEKLPLYLSPLRQAGARSFLILPIGLKQDVSGMICLGYEKIPIPAEEDVLLARDFANHVAVALSNANWEERLYSMAHYDALTGLPNRLLFEDRLQRALVGAERHKAFVAVFFIDLDRFKYVNDSLGHLAGDLLLREVARRLGGVVRNEDTVSRLGGDEFVVVIPYFDNIQESLSVTTTVANKIITAFSRPFQVEDRHIYSTASIGIACYPTDGRTTGELLKNADSAMYHAKANGRNNYQFYSRALNAAAVERLDMENALRQALRDSEFELYYQPKIDIRSRCLVGAEALLRWYHPLKGLIQPSRFIPLCEEIGLITPIGEWVINTACKQARDWQNQGFTSLRIAVNLSPFQFRHPDLLMQVKEALRLNNPGANMLELEITESAAMEDINKTIAILGLFRDMGLHLSIDDFGTGYSSLSCLKRFPIHSLKIDQSFIRNLHASFEDTAIVRSIIDLAHSLGFSVVAEGVENLEQFEYLRRHGCDEAQGYLYHPPLPVEEFTALLSSRDIGCPPLVGL